MHTHHPVIILFIVVQQFNQVRDFIKTSDNIQDVR